MSGLGSKGTIDFRHDTLNDIVIQRPRWKLDSSLEVVRWYQMQAGYFGARFKERKDVIVLNEAFDVTPQVGELWGQYRARLHEDYIRHSVRVANNARVRLATNTSGVRYTVSSLECATLEEAIEAILAARKTSNSPSGFHPRSTQETAQRTPSSPPPKVGNS
jgi:hypothetical protein